MIWLILFVCLILVGRRTRFSWFSPVVLFLLFFLLVIFFSVPYHYLVPKNMKYSIAALDFINNHKFWKIINVFGKMLIYFSIGVILFKYIFNIRKNPVLNLDLKISMPKISNKILIGISSAIILMNLVLLYMTYGSMIFSRVYYQVEFNKLMTMMLEYSLLFVVFLGGVVYKENKTFSILSAMYVVIVCLGFGSRMATIYLAVYMFTIFMLHVPAKKKNQFILISAPLLLLFFGFNFSLRLNPKGQHGLIPYLSLPFTNPKAIIENTFYNIYYTFIFGVFSAYKTMSMYPPGYNYLLTSLNPAPGGMTDWYVIFKRLRINPYAPFAAIGEIFSFPVIAAFFYIFIGGFFAYVEKKIYKLLVNRNFVGGFILFLLTSAFIPYSFEYNLRSSVRFIYYAIIFMIILRLMPKISFKSLFKSERQTE